MEANKSRIATKDHSAAKPQAKRTARRPGAQQLRLKEAAVNLPNPPPFVAAATRDRSRSGKILAKLHDSEVLQCKDRKESLPHKLVSMCSLRSFAANISPSFCASVSLW